MKAPQVALRIQGLRVRYGQVEAVHGIDLQVGAGQLVALLGPNGAGKTSTVLAVMGLVAAEGEVEVFGASVAGLPPWRRAALGLSWVPEGRRVLGELTVEENLCLGAFRSLGPWGGLSPEARRRMADVFELFPVLSQRRRQLAGTLSGGEQQMLALGRALMSDPRVLLVDEATTGLMPRAAEQVMTSLESLRRRGLALVLVEQNVRRALEVADHAYVMESGRIVLSGPGRELLDDPQVTSAYFGRLGR